MGEIGANPIFNPIATDAEVRTMIRDYPQENAWSTTNNVHWLIDNSRNHIPPIDDIYFNMAAQLWETLTHNTIKHMLLAVELSPKKVQTICAQCKMKMKLVMSRLTENACQPYMPCPTRRPSMQSWGTEDVNNTQNNVHLLNDRKR